MKVGDLVVLSKYGKERKYNKLFFVDTVGLVVKVHHRLSYSFEIKWCTPPKAGRLRHCRRELKYAYR